MVGDQKLSDEESVALLSHLLAFYYPLYSSIKETGSEMTCITEQDVTPPFLDMVGGYDDGKVAFSCFN